MKRPDVEHLPSPRVSQAPGRSEPAREGRHAALLFRGIGIDSDRVSGETGRSAPWKKTSLPAIPSGNIAGSRGASTDEEAAWGDLLERYHGFVSAVVRRIFERRAWSNLSAGSLAVLRTHGPQMIS